MKNATLFRMKILDTENSEFWKQNKREFDCDTISLSRTCENEKKEKTKGNNLDQDVCENVMKKLWVYR